MKRWTILLGGLMLMASIVNGPGMNQTMAAENLKKTGMILVDPGFSKYSLKIADQISKTLTNKGYSVTLMTVDRYHGENMPNVDLLVLGGPTYAGQPSGGLKKAISSLKKCNNLKVLLFITGGSDYTPGLDSLERLAAQRGMEIVGKCGFLVQESSPAVKKIDQLLLNLQ